MNNGGDGDIEGEDIWMCKVDVENTSTETT